MAWWITGGNVAEITYEKDLWKAFPFFLAFLVTVILLYVSYRYSEGERENRSIYIG